MEPFTFIEEAPTQQLFDRFHTLSSAPHADHDIDYQASLKQRFPHLTVTAIPSSNCNIVSFAAAGHATVEVDDASEPTAGWRGWIPDYGGAGKAAGIGLSTFFARYKLIWKGESFILYSVGNIQYLLKEPAHGQSTTSTPAIVDQLITTVGRWQQQGVIWVYDNYWKQDQALFDSVQKASWDKVILDENMKKSLVGIATTFFDNKDLYDDLGIAWKRGIIFHGPPGNGKTISLKALMHTLSDRNPPVPTLYVKAAPYTFNIGQAFSFARQCAPCLLVFEDIETIVNPMTRSYFLNEIDGLDSNDGILMVGTTNYLDRLDPGITKRPSRFDRLFLFPPPNNHERILYAEFWRHKILSKDSKRVKVDFPERLCPAMAAITDGFSFAYMQEAFVASLLVIAQGAIEKSILEAPSEFAPSRVPYTRSPASQALYAALNPHDVRQNSEFDDLNQYKLWTTFKDQVRILRENMDNSTIEPVPAQSPPPKRATPELRRPLPDFRTLRPANSHIPLPTPRRLPILQPTVQNEERPSEATDYAPAATNAKAALPAKVQFINTAAYMLSPPP